MTKLGPDNEVDYISADQGGRVFRREHSKRGILAYLTCRKNNPNTSGTHGLLEMDNMSNYDWIDLKIGIYLWHGLQLIKHIISKQPVSDKENDLCHFMPFVLWSNIYNLFQNYEFYIKYLDN